MYRTEELQSTIWRTYKSGKPVVRVSTTDILRRVRRKILLTFCRATTGWNDSEAISHGTWFTSYKRKAWCE